jgi:hypothetical protein
VVVVDDETLAVKLALLKPHLNERQWRLLLGAEAAAIAYDVLSGIVPGAVGFEPDEIPGLQPDAWQPFPVDDLDPTEVNAAFLRYCESRVRGLLVLVTFTSYRPGIGPFFVLQRQLPNFVETYAKLFDDVVVSGDLVVLSPANGCVTVVHHNGLINTLQGSPYAWDT